MTNPFRDVYLKSLSEEEEKKEKLGKGGKVETKKYSWGTMKTVHHGSDFSIPLHPEHHQAISKLKDNQEHKFKDETGRHWTAKKMGDNVHFQGANNGGKTHVPHHTMKEDYVNEVSSELLDRYKEKAKKSADDSTAKGDYKKATSRWANVMKATGKQIDKTTAGIKKALNKEGFDESMTDSWKQVQSMDKGSVTSGKEGAKKRLAYLNAVHAHHKKYGNDTKKVKGEIESINRSRIAEEQIDEISQKLAGNYYGAATKKHIDKVGVKPDMYNRIEKDMGKQRKAGVDRALDRITGSRKTNEETEMQEGLKPEHKMRPGWMLKADPELKAKVDANKKKYKEFKQNVGKKTNEEVEVIDEKMGDAAKTAVRALINAKQKNTGEKSTISGTKKAIDFVKQKTNEAVEESTDTVKKVDGKVVSWKHEGDWKKANPKKNPEGRVHNLAGQAVKKTKELTKEETEQLDEISPELQHRYFKKAYDEQPDRSKQTKQRRRGMDKVINRTLRRNTISTPGAGEDFKDQEKKRGIGHVRDHVEYTGEVVEARRANTASARAELANRPRKPDSKEEEDRKKRESDAAWERLMNHAANNKKQNEEVEQIDELDKSTLASYATKAADSAHTFRNTKRGARRLQGIKKAVTRLAKEEVEQIEERNKENAIKRKMMDASRGARFKLKNPVPDAGPEHKTPQAHNKAIGRALRNEEIVDEACDCEVKPRHGLTEPDMANQASSLQRAKMATNKLAKKTIKTEEVINEEGYTLHSKHTNADGTHTVVLKSPSGKLIKHTGKGVHGYVKRKYGIQSEEVQIEEAKTNDIVCANCGGPVHKGACDDKATWSQKMDKKLNKEQKEIGHDDEAAVKKHLDKIQSPLQKSILKKIQDMQKKRLEIVDNMPTAGGHSAEVNFREELATESINMEETPMEYTQEELSLIEQFIDIAEKMNMSKASMGEVIKDFKASSAPQFAGKSAEKRREMAIAAKMKSEETSISGFASFMLEYETDKSGKYVHKGKYGTSYDAGSDDDDKPESSEKRGRGRPAGSASGARQKGSAAKKKNSGVEYTGYKLHLPNK